VTGGSGGRWAAPALLALASAALYVGLAGIAACARDEPPASRASLSIVADEIISVANETPNEKRIVLKGGTVEHILGVVTGHSSRSFPMPSGLGDAANA